MSFFNPFRKNPQSRDERREPSANGLRDDASGAAPASSGAPTSAPWGEPPRAMPGEPAQTPQTVRLGADGVSPSRAGALSSAPQSTGGIPPAFEEVKPAREAFDPYGIAAQAQAAEKAQARERAAAETAPAAFETKVEPDPVDLRTPVEEPAKADGDSGIDALSGASIHLEGAARSPEPASPVLDLDMPAAAQAFEEDAPAKKTASQTRARKRFEAVQPEEPEEPIEEHVISEPQAAPEKRRKVPLVRELTEDEIIARRRTKHRLVGAAALLLAVVVAAPFILDSESSFETAAIDTTIPSVSDNTATLEVPPVPPDAVDVPDPIEASDSAAASAPSVPTGAAEGAAAGAAKTAAQDKPKADGAQKPDGKAAKPDSKTEAKSNAQPQKAEGKTEEKVKKPAAPSVGIAPPTGKGFYVQVMATSSELEAERTVKKLALLGLPAYRAAVDRKATTLWRVRVGLYKTKKEAEGVVGTIVLNGIASKPIVGSQ